MGSRKSWFAGLRCQRCDSLHPLGANRCPHDQGMLLAEYAPKLRQFRLHKERGIWRFCQLLPPLSRKISRDEGGTPIVPAPGWGRQLGVDLWFKDEGANPSGSFKDRGVAVMASALPQHVDTVVMMSSGNAAGSVALYATLSGVHAVVFMYQGGTREKTFITQAYGATVVAVDAERESDVLHLAEQASAELGWPLMNTVVDGNPLILEGYKTLAYELALELGDIDAVLVPVGSGTLLSGIWKGFREANGLGLTSRMPRLIGAQPKGSCPIVNAFDRGLHSVPPLGSPPNTLAAALTLDNPKESGVLALRAVRESKGVMLAVEDEAILAAWHRLAHEGIALVEPAGAAGAAAIDQAWQMGALKCGERVVCVLTGHGLKDIASVEQLLPAVPVIEADLSAFYQACPDAGERDKIDSNRVADNSQQGGD